MLIAGSQAHLLVLVLVPARDDVQAKPSVTHMIDGYRHASADSGMHGQRRYRRIQLDTFGYRCESGHERIGILCVVPVFRLAAETAMLDHGQGEFETQRLAPERHITIQLPGRHRLCGRFRRDKAVLCDWQKDAEFQMTH